MSTERFIAPLAAAVAGLSLVLLLAATAGARPAHDCRATFDPGRVAVQERPVTVHATLSDPVDEIERVTPEEGSGLEIRSVPSPSSPTDVAIVLDVSGAEPGEWTLTIEGPDTACEGPLSVTEGPIAARTSTRPPTELPGYWPVGRISR